MTMRLPIVFAALLALSGCDYIQSIFTPKPDIKFATYSTDYQSKPDFAAIEQNHPLPPVELDKITPYYLSKLDQEQIDQIYARLSAGPIPDGAFDGDLFFPRGGSGKLRLSEIVGGLPGLVVQLKGKKLDLNELANSIVSETIDPQPEQKPDDTGKNPAAVSLGRLGGLKGGKARAKSMTKKERSEAAKKAARARWKKE